MPKAPASAPDRSPLPPLTLACTGCRWGTRVVDVEETRPEEDGDEWKAVKRREVIGFYCVHPVVHDPGESSVIVTNRVECGFREGK